MRKKVGESKDAWTYIVLLWKYIHMGYKLWHNKDYYTSLQMPKVTSLSCCHVWFASVNTFYSPIWHVTSLFFFFFFWLELMEWCRFSLAYIHILTITKFSTTWNVPQCDITIQWSFLGDGYWYLGRYGFKISFIVSNHYWGCYFSEVSIFLP